MPRVMRLFRLVAPALCLLSLLLLPHVAFAGLTIDLRLANGGGDRKWFLPPFENGAKIPIDVYAIVTGEPGNAGIEGFQSAQGAFVATQIEPGSIRGRILPAGDLDQATFSVTLPALDPFTAQGAQRGASKEIGAADGIIDLGDTLNRGDLGDLVVFRAPNLQVTSGTVIPNGREFKIGHIEFEMEEFRGPGATINWQFRRTPAGGPSDMAALFRQDGVNRTGLDQIGSGRPIVITWIPEPATLAWAALAAAAALRRRPRA